MNLLIPYIRIYGHEDPLFCAFTYGDVKGKQKSDKKQIVLHPWGSAPELGVSGPGDITIPRDYRTQRNI